MTRLVRFAANAVAVALGYVDLVVGLLVAVVGLGALVVARPTQYCCFTASDCPFS
jgi:hypothetical protein